MKEIWNWILSRVPKGILVTLVVTFGMIIGRAWFNDYKEGQCKLLDAVNNTSVKVTELSNDVQEMRDDIQVQNMQIDTIANGLDANRRNTLRIIRDIYKMKAIHVEEPKPIPEPVKHEPLSEIDSKYNEIMVLNNEIANEINIPQPVKKND